MCGIVGYIGSNEAAPILVEALRRLEYRGYDSAGIATLHQDRIQRRRAVGKLDGLSNLLVREPIRGTIGIGHTRWATHGSPTVANAHPHVSSGIVIVHNGIIENWAELQAELVSEGHVFTSETDSEVIPALCQKHIDRGHPPFEAFCRAVDELEGQYAICAMFAGNDDLVCAARRGSPLAVGHGNGTMYIASDALGLSGLTGRMTYLHDGDRAEITSGSLKVVDAEGAVIDRGISTMTVDGAGYNRQGFKHYMLKEIHEQPGRLEKAIRSITGSERHDGLDSACRILSRAGHVRLVGCGTAHYSSLVGAYCMEKLLRVPAQAEIASEFRYRDPHVGPDSTTLFISQSGETADTLAAQKLVVTNGGHEISLLNNMTSTMARDSGNAIPIVAGLEIGVASTKAYTCQLTMLIGLAILAAAEKGTMTGSERDRHLEDLTRLPGMINAVLGLSEELSHAARKIAGHDNVLFIGRNSMYPTALEGALKLKEISYIHAEGLAAGELKHGPIALIEKTVPTVVLAPSNDLFRKTVSNMEEILARNGPVVLVTDHLGAGKVQNPTLHTITLPEVSDLLAPIVYVVPLQLLAYHTAVLKGTDVDMPRNLAKSVTVE